MRRASSQALTTDVRHPMRCVEICTAGGSFPRAFIRQNVAGLIPSNAMKLFVVTIGSNLYCPRVLGQWFDGIRFYAAASSPRRSRRTWAGLR